MGFPEDPLLCYSQVINTIFGTSLLFLWVFSRTHFYFLGYSLIIWTLSKIFIFIFAPFNHWAPLPIFFFLELSPSLCLVSPLFARPFGSSKAHVLLQLCGLGLPSPRPMSFISMGWISLVSHFRSQQQLMHLII